MRKNYNRIRCDNQEFDYLAYAAEYADCSEEREDGDCEDQDGNHSEEREKDSRRDHVPESWEEVRTDYGKHKVHTLDADHGHPTYSSYGAYRNENRKIRSDRRKDYAFYSDQEGRYYYVSVGDSSAVDNMPVTEADIKWLHQMRDREVYHNNKYRYQTETDEEFLVRMAVEKEKMLEGLPNDYEWMEEELKEKRLVINAETFVDEFGNDMTDHMQAFSSPKTVESELGLNCTDLEFAIDEIMQAMTKNEREVFTLVRVKNLPRTTVAKMLGVTEGTIRYRLKSADEKVKSDPFIQNYWQKAKKHSDRLVTWDDEQKAKKKAKKTKADEKKAAKEKARIVK